MNAPIRLPLSVGTGSLWSWARAVLGLATVAGLALALSSFVQRDLDGGSLVGMVLSLIFLVMFILFVAQNARRALQRGASDLMLDDKGIRVSGGLADGLELGWSELQAPGASVDERDDRRVTLAGMFGSVVMTGLTLATSGENYEGPRPTGDDLDPNADVGKWVLVLHGITNHDVAETDESSEARSFKSARSSIAAAHAGRTEAAAQPTVERTFLTCPSCAGPQVLVDAATVTCPFCAATVPVSDEFRRQAQAVAALGQSFARPRDTVARLQHQPLGRTVALVIAAGAVLMALSFVVFWGLAWTKPGRFTVELVPLPLAVMGLTVSLIRAWLARRGALRMLSLGYGALAPAQQGQAPRCRRCIGPLPGSPAGAVERCGYCGTDNVMGIDLRPVVHATRAAEETLEPMLAQLARERRWALMQAALCLAATVAWCVVWFR